VYQIRLYNFYLNGLYVGCYFENIFSRSVSKTSKNALAELFADESVLEFSKENYKK